tara:strand:- start:793 stop:1005 length:213 start_codon:yes stop_codon:yes gene_type:complete
MQQPTQEELEESIKELTKYKKRLEKEVVIISNKLKMPQKKIDTIIKSHSELNQIKIILSKLNNEKKKYMN